MNSCALGLRLEETIKYSCGSQEDGIYDWGEPASCADTPSPDSQALQPRRPHMSPSLLLSLWECMGASDGPDPEQAGGGKTYADPGTGRRTFTKKTRRLPAGHLLWALQFSPRVPTTPGSLSALWVKDRKASLAPEGEGTTFLPLSWPLPQQVLGFHQFPLELTCTWGISLTSSGEDFTFQSRGVRV